ncbi:MAG: hypothetical protein U1B30_15720 [Pseudomonadota bacterium]|nr:hypothetical protein [Pseudomonadota bacterium]
MVMLVTQQGPGRGAGISALGRPRVHVALIKNPGGSLSCTWTARNEGPLAGGVFLSLLNITPGWPLAPEVASSVLVTLAPGITANLLLFLSSLQVGVHVANGLNNMRLDMRHQDGQLIAIHDFPLTITPVRSFANIVRTISLNGELSIWEDGLIINWPANVSTDLIATIIGQYTGPQRIFRASAVFGSPGQLRDGVPEVLGPGSNISFALSTGVVSWPGGSHSPGQTDTLGFALQEDLGGGIFDAVQDIPFNPAAQTIRFT